MLIPITTSDSSATACPEWALIEMQGEVHLSDEVLQQAMCEVGTLVSKVSVSHQLYKGTGRAERQCRAL